MYNLFIQIFKIGPWLLFYIAPYLLIALLTNSNAIGVAFFALEGDSTKKGKLVAIALKNNEEQLFYRKLVAIALRNSENYRYSDICKSDNFKRILVAMAFKNKKERLLSLWRYFEER